MTARARRICWPTPDAVCLQGGCSYCNEYGLRPLAEIYVYAQRHDMLRDYHVGWDNFWWNRVEVR